MDFVKEAFQKVKEDILNIKKEQDAFALILAELKDEIKELKKLFFQLDFKENLLAGYQKNEAQTPQYKTDNSLYNPCNPKFLGISNGNEGVSTDRQTDRQTDKTTQILIPHKEKPLENALEILASLDNLKKEIRLKFKKLTEKEWLVFSTIYQLEEEMGYSNHKLLSEKLCLSESSIRDYVSRLVQKGVPLVKTKINNKSVRISVSENLKKIASLSVILKLREL